MPPPSATIAHVLHRLDFAGAELLAADLARKLRSQYRFAFFCLDALGPLGQSLRAEGFPVIELHRRPGIDLRLAFRLRREVRRLNVQLLHAHQYTPFFYAAASRTFSSHPPILFTEHGRHFPDYPRPKRIFANRFLLKPTDRVTAVGNYVRQLLIANERIAPNRITVVHNGIDPDRFASTDRTQARQLLSLADDELAILHVARFHPVKDHATALRAFSRIVTQSPRARLILVGDGAQRPTIEALVRELSLHHHVRLLGVRDDIPQLLLAADLFILTSLSEGISVTLLEAMAARLPIAATDVGGNSEVVDHNHTGLLSPRSDDQALASNLLTLLNDPALRQRMGNAGRQRLLDHFTQDKMHHAYAGIYQQMIA